MSGIIANTIFLCKFVNKHMITLLSPDDYFCTNFKQSQLKIVLRDVNTMSLENISFMPKDFQVVNLEHTEVFDKLIAKM